MAFPKYDMQYALIMDAATSTEQGGHAKRIGAILTKIDKDGNLCAISLALLQLRDHEKNYSPFLLEATAAMREMDIFNKYLWGQQFILYTDHKPLEKAESFTNTKNQQSLINTFGAQLNNPV